MKSLSHYIQHLVLAAGCLGASMATLSQTPNGAKYPNAPTQTVPTAQAAYGSNTPVNLVRIWEAVQPAQHDTVLSSKYAAVNTVNQMTKYFDGSGRPLQTVVKRGSPLGRDVVTPVMYDESGREALQYLPYASASSDGDFKTDPFTAQSNFYTATYNPGNNASGEKFFFNRTEFEASPLGRIEKNYAPGNSWVGSNAGVSTSYLLNTDADSVRIWNIVITPNAIPTSTAFYAAGLLYKKVTVDERGYSTIEYTDKENKTLLKKVQAVATPATGHSGWLSTYYIYDDGDNLRFVIQPKGTDRAF